MSRKLLSLLVPVYFEEECIEQFILETRSVLNNLDINYEYIFVDDGSRDRTVEIIKELAKSDQKIKLIEFSYNHGKQAAVTAAINLANGDYLLYMDPDLQDPPDQIPAFLSKIQEGYDLVFGIREEKVDSTLNKFMSETFWYVLRKFTELNIPKGLAVMRIFNRKFANKFIEYGEQNRFIEGIFMHIGLKNTSIIVSQRARFAGQSKFNFRRKMRLAMDAIFDFSEFPLKLAVKFGFALSFLGAILLVILCILKLLFINYQIGWPSIISSIILGAGLQIFFSGLIAIYVGRIYKEVKKRPLYSIKELTNLE